MKSYHIICPKCNNNHNFYRHDKTPDGYQKYLCWNCRYQFAPERPRPEGEICRRKYPPYPVRGKASFLHHDYQHYATYRCCDKKCNHSTFHVSSVRKIRLQAYALSVFYLGKNSFRNISLILKSSFSITEFLSNAISLMSNTFGWRVFRMTSVTT